MRCHLAGRWIKGNTHVHSTASDGGKSAAQLAAMYAAKGYEFLFLTDHWAASDFSREKRRGPVLWMDGLELDGSDASGSYFHVVCLGRFTGIHREMGFEAAMESVRRQAGLRVLAHPFWTGNSVEDVRRWDFDGVETYNHVCHWLNGKGDGMVHWEWALSRNPRVMGFASDDAHVTAQHPGWNGGWTMVNAEARTPGAIMTAIRAGRFYGTSGPEFAEIECDGARVTVRTSPVRFARLVGPATHGRRAGAFRGKLLTGASFEVPPDWPYAYVEIEDSRGRRARTNNLL
jgi:hypothetical protein